MLYDTNWQRMSDRQRRFRGESASRWSWRSLRCDPICGVNDDADHRHHRSR